MKLLSLLAVSAIAGGMLGYVIGALYIRLVIDRPGRVGSPVAIPPGGDHIVHKGGLR